MLPAFVAKLCPRAELQPRLAELARPLVFTNGVFDILHRGHVTYLAQARAWARACWSVSTATAGAQLGKAPADP